MTTTEEASSIPNLGLADVIMALRGELESAVTSGQSSRLRFEIQGLSVELKVGVTGEVGGSAGIKFWVVDLGGNATYAREVVHTVNLTLRPTMDGDGVKIAELSEASPLSRD